jgi:hypothetical protein
MVPVYCENIVGSGITLVIEEAIKECCMSYQNIMVVAYSVSVKRKVRLALCLIKHHTLKRYGGVEV